MKINKNKIYDFLYIYETVKKYLNNDFVFNYSKDRFGNKIYKNKHTLLKREYAFFECQNCKTKYKATFRNVYEKKKSPLCPKCCPSFLTKKQIKKEDIFRFYSQNTLKDTSYQFNVSRSSLKKFLKKWNKLRTDEYFYRKIVGKKLKENFKNEEKKERIVKLRKETMLKRYGDENYNVKKAKKTLLERYGEDSPLKIKTFVEKLQQTNQKKYGVKCTFQSDIVKEKIQKTIFERYNVKNVRESQEINEKIIQTNLKKYGFKYGLQNKEIQNKARNTLFKNYKVDNPGLINNKFAYSKQEELCYNAIKHLGFVHNTYKKGVFYFIGTLSNGVTKKKYPDFCLNEKSIYGEFNGSFYHKSKEEISNWISLYNSKGFKCFVVWDFELKELINNPPKTVEELLIKYPCTYRVKQKSN